MLELVGLTKTVPGGRTLFSDLNFTLARGEFVAIMGESGVGKSTLLNLVAGLDEVDAGDVVVDGESLAALDDDARTRLRRRKLGFVFQAFHVLPHLSVVRNVALPLMLQGTAEKAALERAAAMLERVGLAGRGADVPRALSGGELQRVAIARALVHRPALILADEPTGNLDPETAHRVLAIMSEQIRSEGASALLVTHSDVAAASADRRVRLSRQGLTALD